MAETTSKQQWTEIGIRLIGVYLCASSAIAAVQGIYMSIFGGVGFFGTFFHTVVSAGAGIVVGGALAFGAGTIGSMLAGDEAPKAP